MMSEVQQKYYVHIDEIIEDAKRFNSHFFDESTMRFFSSRILPTVYGGRYFITSERDVYRDSNPRVYTIRKYIGGGTIGTVGDFGGYRLRRQAVSALKKVLKQHGIKTEPPRCPRCAGLIPSEEDAGKYAGALSRLDNKTEICSRCGNIEAIENLVHGEIFDFRKEKP
jgi:ribosomal protein S27AE